MELKKLYIVELSNGEKKYFGKEWDRSWYLNQLKDHLQITAKIYEIELN